MGKEPLESHIRSEPMFHSSKKIQFIGLSKPLARSHKDQMAIESLLTSPSFDRVLDRRLGCDTTHKRRKRNKMTCYYSAVAQKSYGTEKRFLCPPPRVSIEQASVTFQLSTAILCESRQEQVSQSLDQGQGNLRYLFVNAHKAKQFQLELNLLYQQLPVASFCTQPIAILSKPSKKKKNTTGILPFSRVSLYNRINSQTVRTKYMTVHQDNLWAHDTTWSPFEIIAEQVRYGSPIVLKERETGVCSPPLVLCKVERGQLAPSATGPVSQLQKVALRQTNSNLYLSAMEEGEGALLFALPQKMDTFIWTIVGVHILEQEFDDI
ncbi:beta-trefoil DNA-binding domain-containing protein [Sporodiniella umbellata]|nr:beta-trefoil DNA-binding domain-containing protein [Sporodiniella umbellata]